VTGPLRVARMAGSSIATPGAAGWVTDFLNAAYFARPARARDVDDLRLAHGILTTRWASHPHRRLGARDLAAFHRSFGARRLRAGGRLDRDTLLEGAGALVGDWFAAAWADQRRRAHGIAFRTVAERRAFDPASRARHAAIGALTPPTAPPGERPWTTYRPVPLADADAALRFLRDPGRWPDMGSASGRFTALRTAGLHRNTFEIEIHAQALPRLAVATRGYVTCTSLNAGGRALTRSVDAIRAHVEDALPGGSRALALVALTTHAGHFMGRAISNLLVFEAGGGAFIRDIGTWDPLPAHLAAPYALAGRAAQKAFWEPDPPALSMLAQLALVTRKASEA
jgi:hypothetical protein